MKITTIRHSLAHLLAYAVRELYPEVRLGIGPSIENGFYYDFEFKNPISNEDLQKIEKKMKELIKQNIKFEKKIVSRKEVEKIFKNQPHKLELIKEIKNKITIFKCGNFIDLCSGPHVKSSKEINPDAFKLTKIAGAYWRGDEKKTMLTRIYGTAFKTKKELNAHFKLMEEVGKRDHRKIGEKLELFFIDENIGPGLILWQPKGALLKKIIIDYALNEYLKEGYQLVDTPHIAKLNLWEISGHTKHYKENMMPPFHMAEIDKEEKDDYQIKPMNCPFHIAIYKKGIKSYKDLPIRYTEIGTVYRYEKSGTLHGLTRVRQITQDDAHIFCTADQISGEIISVLKLTIKILNRFGLKQYYCYLSTRPKNYIGDLKLWKKAENSLKHALDNLKLNYKIDPGGGAFYGPKIDIKIKDSIGREWQCTTIQFDFNLPERFDVNYINKKGEKEKPFVIHRALLGSLERFIGVLIEHYAGAFPLWLSPEQIWIIPVGSRHEKYANNIIEELTSCGLRVKLKDENETVSKKIRDGETQKIPYLLVVGDKEMKNNSVRIRSRNKDLGEIKLKTFIEKIKKEIENKK